MKEEKKKKDEKVKKVEAIKKDEKAKKIEIKPLKNSRGDCNVTVGGAFS